MDDCGIADNGNVKVAVIGLGYVGLPLAMAFAGKGVKVYGIDLDAVKVRMLRRGMSYIDDVSAHTVRRTLDRGLLAPMSRFNAVEKADAVIICVPTPLRKTRDPDISYIIAAVNEIRKYIRKHQIIILESTTYPGTTREIILPLLEKKHFRAGRDFYLAFSPERIDPGNKKYNVTNTPKIIGGITPRCTAMAVKLYSRIISRVISVSSPESAEMVKLLENTFRAVNIGLVNEIALMCRKLKLNVWEVIEAASTKPYGFMPFYPGPGLGGHCIPVDPFYLSWKLRTLNFNARFIELAGEINSNMPEEVVDITAQSLNAIGRPLKGTGILVLGITYKENVADIRESPALDIMRLLEEKEAHVDYHDPYIESWENKKSVSWNLKMLGRYHCVIITAAHAFYNIRDIVKKARLIIDTRNATCGISNKKIVRL